MFYFVRYKKTMRAFERSVLIQNLRYRSTPTGSVIAACAELGIKIHNDSSNFELTRLAGGQFGTVFTISGRRKKVLKEPNSRATLDETLRELMLSKVKHQNVIEIDGWFRATFLGRHGILMEQADNDLFRMIDKNGAIEDNARLQQYALHILTGVSHLHEKQIFHFDVKPENILMCGDTLKLADFGLSHSQNWSFNGAEFGSLGQGVRFFGTPGYIPHEQLANHGKFVDKRDMWATGCTIFVMAYGSMLYHRHESRHYIALLHKLITAEPPYFSDLIGRPHRSVKLEELLADLIAFFPELSMQQIIGKHFGSPWP